MTEKTKHQITIKVLDQLALDFLEVGCERRRIRVNEEAYDFINICYENKTFVIKYYYDYYQKRIKDLNHGK